MEKNLQNTQAITKLQNLISDVNTCMLITNGKSGGYNTRPMTVVDTDASGNLWMFAKRQSHKVKDIEDNGQVQLVFAHPARSIYMDIHGRASIETDKQYIADKWNPLVKAWFTDGINDPDVCLIKVRADEAHYWDIEGSKMGIMVKIAVSAVTGKKLEEGVHGALHF